MHHREALLTAAVALMLGAGVYVLLRTIAPWPLMADDSITALVVASTIIVLAPITRTHARVPDEPESSSAADITLAWRSRLDGRVLSLDRRMAAAFGYSIREAVVMSLSDLIHTSERDRLWNLISADRGWRDETFRCETRAGAPLWIRTTAAVDNGGLVGTAQLIDYQPVRSETNRETRTAIHLAIARDQVRTAFQPIVCVATGAILGAEALSRFAVHNASRSVEQWFADATRAGLGMELDVHAATAALRAASMLPADIYVSINLSATTITWPSLANALARTGFDLGRVVIEITEHEPVVDYVALGRAIDSLRQRGLRIAADDAGSGFAGLNHILKLAPDYIKLDRAIIAGLDSDAAKRAMTAAITTFADDTGTTVIAEGVETDSELAILRNLGVTAAQGYLFHRPSTEPSDWARWNSLSPRSDAPAPDAICAARGKPCGPACPRTHRPDLCVEGCTAHYPN